MTMTIKGYAAIKLLADLHADAVKPGNVKVSRTKKLKWEEATQEQKDTLVWTSVGTPNGEIWKTAYLPLTEEEKQMRKENQIYHLYQMYEYILENYGVEYARRFAIEKDLEEVQEVPYCSYGENQQCNISCPYYNKKGCLFYDSEY